MLATLTVRMGAISVGLSWLVQQISRLDVSGMCFRHDNRENTLLSYPVDQEEDVNILKPKTLHLRNRN